MKHSALLLVIVASLLVVGLVSHTILRHLIQIVPVLVAVFLIQQNVSWAKPFSAAIGLACVGILTNSFRQGIKWHFLRSAVSFAGGIALQIFFMWLSMGDKK